MNNKNPEVSIIILNWNGWEDTIECIESLLQSSYNNIRILLVDNGSTDESLENIKSYFEGELNPNSQLIDVNQSIRPIELDDQMNLSHQSRDIHIESDSDNRIILLELEKNIGFTGGNNVGIEFAIDTLDSEYILLLNNDTIVHTKMIEELVEKAEQTGPSLYGGKSYFYDQKEGKNTIEFAGGKFNTLRGTVTSIGRGKRDDGQYDSKRSADYLQGSCLMFNREVLIDIGLLKEDYFAYWEDIEICYRAVESGYRCYVVPQAKLWHKGGASSPTGFSVELANRNRWLFLKEHMPIGKLCIQVTYFLLFKIWVEIFIYLIYKRNTTLFRKYLYGNFRGLVSK